MRLGDTDCVEWVRMRADCLLDRLFKNLHAIVGHDSKQANCYSPFAEQGYEFVLDPDPFNGRSEFTVTRKPKMDAPAIIKALPEHWVKFTFKASDETIEIRYFGNGDSPVKPLKVKADWNHESERCGIMIDGHQTLNGEFYKPWQISREALSPLIFP